MLTALPPATHRRPPRTPRAPPHRRSGRARRRRRRGSAAPGPRRRRRRARRGRRARCASSSPTVAPCAHFTSSAKISSSGLALIVAVRASSRPRSDCSASVFCAGARPRPGRRAARSRGPSATARQTWRLAARRGMAQHDGASWRWRPAPAARRRPRQRRLRRASGSRRRSALSAAPAPRNSETRLAPAPSSASSGRLAKPDVLEQPHRSHQPRRVPSVMRVAGSPSRRR